MSAESASLDKLRLQRNRFLAFAFAGADLLVEVAGEGKVSFCAGASESLCGRSNDDMVGLAFLDLIGGRDRATASEALRRLHMVGRLGRVRLALQGPRGEQTVLLSGIRLGSAGEVHLAATRINDDAPPPAAIGKDEFIARAEKRLNEARRAGEDYTLTLLDIGGKDTPQAALLADIESHLRAWSVDGETLGRLDDGKYGILHDAAIGQDTFESRLGDIIAQFDGAADVKVSATTVVAADDVSAADLGKALVYTINKFVAEDSQAFGITSLADGYKAAVSDTLSKVQSFRSLIASDRFTFVFQPIVCLKGWRVHHYEALARIQQGERVVLPSRFISFAEDIGLVSEMDMVVCKKAMAVLSNNQGVPPTGQIAVNLSGRSLGETPFVNHLVMLLKEHPWQLPRLLFEVTESAEIKDLAEAERVVQKLRSLGCKVCLDDFGAGAAAFPYLRALHVDYVKIDGSYILDAFDSRHGKPFLRAISSLCIELGIKTVGEAVEDERSVHLLRELGVDYGQGYYFGRPEVDVTTQKLPAPPFGVGGPMSVGQRG